MINQNYLWIIVGLLTIGIAVAIHSKKAAKTVQMQPAERLMDDWDSTKHQPPVLPPVQPPVSPKITPKTYKEAVEVAAKSGKPLLLFFTSRSCPPCIKMKAEFGPSIQAMADQIMYYEVDVDVERDAVRRYNISATPTYMVINGQEQVLKSGVGYKNARSFSEWLSAPYNPPTVPPGPAGQGQVGPQERPQVRPFVPQGG
jgi:thioredoxin 1